MKTSAYVTHSDCSLHDTGWAHPEHQGRLPAVARAVYREMLTLFEPMLEVEAVPATEDDLRLAHDAAYVERVRARAAEAAAAGRVLSLDGDVGEVEETRVSGASWDAARAAAGAGITAVELVLAGGVRNAFCAVRPPGHGAGRASSGAFGLFNTVAIAARHLRERRGLERVLVVEWGAGAGAGTLDVVRHDPGIAFLSLHSAASPLPGPLPPPHLAVALPAGADGPATLALLIDALDRAIAAFRPDFLLLSLGCDALATDPRGDLALLPADYRALTDAVRVRAEHHCAGRLVSVLEEGYDPPAMGLAVVQHLRSLTGVDE